MPDTVPAARILLVDDDIAVLRAFRRCLEAQGAVVATATRAAEAEAAIHQAPFDLCVLDLCLGEDSGLDLLPRLRELAPWLRIIIATASNDVPLALKALRAGAADYLCKPCTPEELLLAVKRQRRAQRLEQRVEQLEHDIEAGGAGFLHTASPAYRATLELAQRVAATDASVLILGENGTGKTQLARAIHQWSPRAQAAFATVSCPSLSAELLASELFGHVRGAFTGATDNRPGRVQIAEGGTLFLDEIGDMPLSLQPKLLRFLQDREYERVGDAHSRTADVRVIAATNRDLGGMLADGGFREDLYYRLNTVVLTLPPLRERSEDIVDLAEEELLRLASRYARPARRFSDEALARLTAHAWPGNLRELHNAVERAVIVSDGEVIGAEHLPFSPASPAGRGLRCGDPVSLAQLERAHIEAIVASAPSLEAAAQQLGIDSSTLYRKRRQYSAEDARRDDEDDAP